MSSDRTNTDPVPDAPPPPVEVSPAELVQTARSATSGGSPIVESDSQTLITTPSGLLKTDAVPAVSEGGQRHPVRLALIIAAALLAAGALLSFLTRGH